MAQNGLSGDWSTYVAGLQLKFGSSLDFGGASVFATASGRVSEHTRAGAQLQLRLGGEVMLKLFISRLGQKLSVPIQLAHYNNPYVVFCSAVLPTAGYAALYHYYILPRKQARIAGRVRELQREHADYTAQKRGEALEAQLAMERVVETRVATERRRNGLIILDAKYGRADAFTPRGYREATAEDGGPAVVDVTVALQMLVADSRLYIPAGRAKHGLNGFYVSYCGGLDSNSLTPPGPVHWREQEDPRPVPLPRKGARGHGRRRQLASRACPRSVASCCSFN
jgi:DnaJ family protein C protein 11